MKLNRGFEAITTCKDVTLPKRSTKNSAGYDFFCPYDQIIPSHFEDWAKAGRMQHANEVQLVKPFCIKTGIKAYMQDNEVLQVYMRSSSPGKLGLIMANSVGIIDADYYNNDDNEGEIGFLVYNLSPHTITIQKGEKLGQGIFTTYLKTDNDKADGIRSGGFGSTGD